MTAHYLTIVCVFETPWYYAYVCVCFHVSIVPWGGGGLDLGRGDVGSGNPSGDLCRTLPTSIIISSEERGG